MFSRRFPFGGICGILVMFCFMLCHREHLSEVVALWYHANMELFTKTYRDAQGEIIKVSIYPMNSIALKVDHSMESKITDRSMFAVDSKMYRAMAIIMQKLKS